jgi:sterol desaturase/sphingolipid hydroxylase (fatty acid hydroxylase superfamily)
MISIIFYVISYDIWFYVSHVILHNKLFYKKIHKDHHNIDYKIINFKDAYTGHFIEGPFQGIGVLFPLFFINLISILLILLRYFALYTLY